MAPEHSCPGAQRDEGNFLKSMNCTRGSPANGESVDPGGHDQNGFAHL